MFRVTFIADDKKLAHALRALDGLAYELQVTPVADAKLSPRGKLVEAPADVVKLAKELPPQFTTADLAAILKRHRRPFKTSAVSNFRQALEKAGLVKRINYRLFAKTGA